MFCGTWYSARQYSENAVEIMSAFWILRKLMILGSLPVSTSTYTMFHAQTNLITSTLPPRSLDYLLPDGTMFQVNGRMKKLQDNTSSPYPI